MFRLPLALVLALAPQLAAAAPSPRPWLEPMVEKGKKLASRKVEAGTPAEAAWNKDIKAIIDETLDWDELTERALGRYWKERSPTERTEFAALLREMIEASYQSKLKLAAKDAGKKPVELTVEWLEEKLNGEDATQAARFKSGKDVVVLTFDMRHRGGRWRVYDVSIDDVSTVRTYRSQFGKIVGKDGFAALMDRLRSKTEEIRSGRAEISPP